MSELPKGWVLKLLGDFAFVKNGFAFKSKDYISPTNASVPIIRISDIHGNIASDKKATHVDKSKIQKGFEVHKGDFLIAMSGATTGKSGIYTSDNLAYQNQRVGNIKLISNNLGCDSYKNYSILAVKDKILENAYGAAQPNISGKALEALLLPIAPLNEQIRIAKKLDSLLSNLEATQKRLDKIPTLLKRFRQSVLAAAVSGELTAEWRIKKGVNMNTWVNDSLEDITLSVSDGDHQAPPRADSGIPFLVISNLSSGEINFHAVKRWVPKEYYDSLKSIRVPRKNDILYTVTGSFGIPVMVRQDREFCFQRHIAIIKPDNEKVDTNFLYRYLGSTGAFEQAKAVATGTAQQTVPLGGLRKFIITCPTIEEQKQIVLQVESLFNLADKVEEHYQTAKQRIDKLTQSILAKAFRGELVPQDPNDEPASELLKRIKTQQLEEAKLIRPNKKTNNKQSRIETRKSKMIIPILEALKEANKPLTGQELFASAGYSNDAETMQVEKYFLDLRDQLENKSISRQRDENKNQDIFTLVSNA